MRVDIDALSTTEIEFRPGHKLTVLQLIESWSSHVLRLYLERNETLESVIVWGMYDLVAALFLRDRLERGLVAAGCTSRVPAMVRAADELFLSFTTDDEAGLVSKLEPVAPDASWWWRRIPTCGPVAEELASLVRDST